MKRRLGLTLIELMVTLAIVALLTTAALATITTLARSQAVRQRADAATVRQQHLERLLAEDFRHATAFRPVPGGFELDSQAALDPATLERRHLSAIIGYTVRQIGPRSWLMRTQRSDSGGDSTEPVCPAVRAVALSVARDPDLAAEAWQRLPVSAGVSFAFDEAAAATPAFSLRTGALP